MFRADALKFYELLVEETSEGDTFLRYEMPRISKKKSNSQQSFIEEF